MPILAQSKKVAALATVAVTALGACGALGGALIVRSTSATAAPIATSDLPAQNLPSLAPLAARVRPAVVSVRVLVGAPKPGAEQAASPLQGLPAPLQELLRRYLEQDGAVTRQPAARQAVSLGSGFIISTDGFIVTNNHVVENAISVSVTLDNGRTLAAKVVGTDPKTDLAVLKIAEAGDYPFVAFAREAPEVGDWVVAIGNPFGLGGSVTAGIVSAKGRDIGAGLYDDFLQIDAPINRGNSGGPTFNLKGEVVGVNTMIYSPSGGSVGLAFAIPASTVQSVVQSLEHDGVVARGYLGVQIQPVDADIAASLGLGTTRGALVDAVVAGTPAEKAGLKAGDVILKLNGEPLTEARDLTRRIGTLKPGDSVDVTVFQNGKEQTFQLTLGAQQSAGLAVPATARSEEAGAPVLGIQLGSLRQVTGQDAPGVIIVHVDPNGAADSKGLSEGDIILEVAGRPVSQPSEVKAEIARARHEGRKAVLLKVRTADTERFVGFALARA